MMLADQRYQRTAGIKVIDTGKQKGMVATAMAVTTRAIVKYFLEEKEVSGNGV
jgi:hypothetical protein